MNSRNIENFLLLLVIIVIVCDFRSLAALFTPIGGAITGGILLAVLALSAGARFLRNCRKAQHEQST